jgi:hypothetical protein
MQRLSFAAITGSAVLLAATGCGGVRHTPVTGLVTVDGQPYGNVLITFVPVDGGGDLIPVGRADDTGKFTMGTETANNGVKPGKYKVTVIPGPPKDSKPVPHPSEAFAKKQQQQSGTAKVNADREYRKLQIETSKANRKPPPSIYSDPARTPLPVVEVTTEPQEVKLALKSEVK